MVSSANKNTKQGRAGDKEDNSLQGNKVVNNDPRQETINALEENGTAQQKARVSKQDKGEQSKNQTDSHTNKSHASAQPCQLQCCKLYS